MVLRGPMPCKNSLTNFSVSAYILSSMRGFCAAKYRFMVSSSFGIGRWGRDFWKCMVGILLLCRYSTSRFLKFPVLVLLTSIISYQRMCFLGCTILPISFGLPEGSRWSMEAKGRGPCPCSIECNSSHTLSLNTRLGAMKKN